MAVEHLAQGLVIHVSDLTRFVMNDLGNKYHDFYTIFTDESKKDNGVGAAFLQENVSMKCNKKNMRRELTAITSQKHYLTLRR